MIVHGGLIAFRHNTDWRGVLIRGSSGTGKSDLALRALTYGFRLVADDRVVLFGCAGRLFGHPHEALAGLIEARGVGIVEVAHLRLAEVFAVVDCVGSAALERMPEIGSALLLGVPVPTIAVCSMEASAPAKLCRAMEVLGRARQQAYDAAFPRLVPRGAT